MSTSAEVDEVPGREVPGGEVAGVEGAGEGFLAFFMDSFLFIMVMDGRAGEACRGWQGGGVAGWQGGLEVVVVAGLLFLLVPVW